MSLWTKALGAVGLKALSRMRFPGRSLIWLDFARPDHSEMANEIGDGTSSDIVMTPVRWLQRAFNESVITVQESGEIVENHPLPALIEKPNPFYAAEHLYAGTVFALSTSGTSYWIKVRNGNGDVAELWWVPTHTIKPKWPDDGNTFISHFEYSVQGQTIPLEIDDVIVFRDGVDPQDVRLGLSPLRGLLREVWTDNEAAMFSAALLKNGGVPGVVISPKGEGGSIELEQAEQVKESFTAGFTRERRGKPIVMTGPTEIHQFGFNPQQLDLSFLRDIGEERVSAALGVPAAVCGFGAGLQQTKVGATMRELRQLAWHNGVIPLQRIIAGAIERQLLPDFGGKGKVVFDNSEVMALAEDENERAERIRGFVKDGIWTRGEARAETGQEVMPADDVFLLPFSVMEVPRTGMPEPVRQPPDEPPESDPEQRARSGIEHKHTLLEERLAETAPKGKMSERIARFARSIDNLRVLLPTSFEGDLVAFFEGMGKQAETAARRILSEERSASGHELKRDPMIAARIAEGIDLIGLEKALQRLYEKHYLRVANEIVPYLAQFFGIEIGLPDTAARALIATGGRRVGLIDLAAKAKKAIFDALVEGRIQGLAGENLARFIREHVAKGPWSSATVRARVIARTETAFATNVSVIEGARNIAGVEKMMIHDARAGDSDETCEALDGRVVTVQEAQELAAAEHPMGTRSFTPLTPQLIEEMGL